MSSWIIRVIFQDYTFLISKCLFNLARKNLISIAFLLRMQRHTIPTRPNECAQTFQHPATLLNRKWKCNGWPRAISKELRATFPQRCLVNQRPAPNFRCGPFLFQVTCAGSLVDPRSARVQRGESSTARCASTGDDLAARASSP